MDVLDGTDTDRITDLCETHAHLPREAAIFMARRAPAWVHHTDLEPAAWHGLYLAAATFDPDRGTEFGSWAWHRICGAIRDDMRGIDHVPPPLLQQLKTGGVMVIPVGPPGAQRVLKVRKEEAADKSIQVTRSDIYGGRIVPFVPFTKLEGDTIKGTHNK